MIFHQLNHDLCREIFQRSVAFRALVTTQTASFYDKLLVAAGEDPRPNVSRVLRAKNRGSAQLTAVLALIESWKHDFGARYPSIVAGYAVLMGRGYVFPRERERQQEAQQQEVDTRRHRGRVCEAKKQQRGREMAQFIPEMEQVLVEMNRIFEILVPTLDAFEVPDELESHSSTTTQNAIVVGEDNSKDPTQQIARGHHGVEELTNVDGGSDEVEWEDVTPRIAISVETGDDDDKGVEWESVSADSDSSREDSMREEEDTESAVGDQMDINDIVQAYGLGSSSYRLTVEVPKRVCEESADNDVLFRALKDNALRMRKRFLPLLDDWEQHSTLPGPASSSPSAAQSQREVLQQIRDLHDRTTHALLKWEDLAQGTRDSQQGKTPTVAVVTLPLDAYEYNPPPVKRRCKSSDRRRQTSNP
ncbi:hypothetical protein BBJ29_010020 [Phytophthora kernoviae]|uniref:VHS domain-containing protein n=1 Tax=Phytophthora kernoviae TaxID=325452 RepID=A0A3R7JTK2_9STRA|nr:hypothetical protein BBJ29_010020 [Phytophthora kernoviae]